MSTNDSQNEEKVSKLEEILTYTHSKRLIIINKLMGNLDNLNDPKIARVALAALADMDSTILTKERLAVDNTVANTHAETAKVIADVLFQLGDPNSYIPKNTVARELPVLGADHPAPELVEGETDAVVSQQTFESTLNTSK